MDNRSRGVESGATVEPPPGCAHHQGLTGLLVGPPQRIPSLQTAFTANRRCRRRDVVGVEGVPHAEDVGGQPQADSEYLCVSVAHRELFRNDKQRQRTPGDQAQHQDHASHPGDAGPVTTSAVDPGFRVGMR